MLRAYSWATTGGAQGTIYVPAVLPAALRGSQDFNQDIISLSHNPVFSTNRHSADACEEKDWKGTIICPVDRRTGRGVRSGGESCAQRKYRTGKLQNDPREHETVFSGQGVRSVGGDILQISEAM